MATLKIELDSVATDATTEENTCVFKMTFYENNAASSSGTFSVSESEPVFLELLSETELNLDED